jgi:hypothetical protein
VRLLWATAGSAQLELVRKELTGVCVEAVMRLTKAAEGGGVDGRLAVMAARLHIPRGGHWYRGLPDYNRVINEIVDQELER